MKKLEEIKKVLMEHKKEIKEKYKVKKIAFFGSYVRNKQKKRSDIDILVEFEEGHKTFDNYMELKFYLEEILNLKIDLILKSAIKEEIKDNILSEAVYV